VRRLFWFGAGIAAGVALTRKVNETARKATPTGMAEQVGGAMRELAGAVGSFGADVRAGMQEREDELHDVVADADQGRRIAAEHDAERRARRAGR
jgi:chromosome condensin MukBEF MukE localization factor